MPVRPEHVQQLQRETAELRQDITILTRRLAEQDARILDGIAQASEAARADMIEMLATYESHRERLRVE